MRGCARRIWEQARCSARALLTASTGFSLPVSNAVAAVVATCGVRAATSVNFLPRSFPTALVSQCFTHSGFIGSEHAPNRKVAGGARLEISIEKFRVPARVHADRHARMFLVSQPHQPPGTARPEALFAIGDASVGTLVLEDGPARILLARFAVVPITHDNLGPDEQPTNVRQHAHIGDALELAVDESSQGSRVDGHAPS